MVNRGDPAFVVEFVHSDALQPEEWGRSQGALPVHLLSASNGIIEASSPRNKKIMISAGSSRTLSGGVL
jgi:hypothetical protein